MYPYIHRFAKSAMAWVSNTLYIYMYIYKNINTHIYVHIFIYTYVCIHMCINTHIYIHMFIYTYVCIYIYIGLQNPRWPWYQVCWVRLQWLLVLPWDGVPWGSCASVFMSVPIPVSMSVSVFVSVSVRTLCVRRCVYVWVSIMAAGSSLR